VTQVVFFFVEVCFACISDVAQHIKLVEKSMKINGFSSSSDNCLLSKGESHHRSKNTLKFMLIIIVFIGSKRCFVVVLVLFVRLK